LPAISVPAGFTSDEVPIGMELLGAAFDEQSLLSLGYSIEQTLKLRQPPFSTPALVAGRAPAPRKTRASGAGVTLDFTYDQTTSRLQFALTQDPKQKDRVAAIWLHSGTREQVGAARHQLFLARGGAATTGSVLLSAGDRRDLEQGSLSVRVCPSGLGERVTIHLPEMRAWQ
jgi:hypothetical protein